MVMDRGYNSARALIECADRGVAVVHYNPWSLSLYDATTAKIDWWAARQKPVRVGPGPIDRRLSPRWPVTPAQAIEARRRGGHKPTSKGA